MEELTIVVPAYNAERALEQCLESFCGKDDRLEVLVINDGSTDRTAEIAHHFASLYPKSVFVIDKENGGFGSCVNLALDRAKGRYFKVVNADDWISTDHLSSVLDTIEEIDADILITGYQTVNTQSGLVLDFLPVSNSSGRQIDMIKLNDKYDDVNPCLEFPCLCYQTAFLRKSGVRLSEGFFYEDLEYQILPFAYAQTFYILPEIFYVSRIVREDQKIKYEKQVKRAGDQSVVARNVVKTYVSLKPMGVARDRFLTRRITRGISTHYATLLVKNPDKKEGRKQAAQFRAFLMEQDPHLVKLSDRKYKTLRRLGRFQFTPRMYVRVYNSRSYVRFKKLWIR